MPPSAYPSMTSREQAAGGESVPNPRHCMKILTGRRGGVAGGRAPVPGTPHSSGQQYCCNNAERYFVAESATHFRGAGLGSSGPSACPSMTPREQAAGVEPVPNPRHCTKILTGGRGGVAGPGLPTKGHLTTLALTSVSAYSALQVNQDD